MNILRHRPSFWIVAGLFPLLVMGLIELGRIVWAWQTVNSAARTAARYAVTGQFDTAYCAKFASLLPGGNDSDRASKCDLTVQRTDTGAVYWPFAGGGYSAWDLCNSYLFSDVSKPPACANTSRSALGFEDVVGAMQDVARLQSIRQVAHDALNNLPVENADNATQTDSPGVVVCSNRPGYSFDAQHMACIPSDDPGAPNDQVSVSVAYNYPVGSLLGETTADLPLRATQTMVVEKFRTARVFGLPPITTEDDGRATTDSPSPSEPSQDRLVIVRGDLQIVVADTAQSQDHIASLAAEVGGYVVKSESWYDGEFRNANVQIRVPAGQFQKVLSQVKGLATRVLRENVTGQDVTEEYVDLDGRLRGLKATSERLYKLLDEAKTVEEALKVNAELGKLEQQTEQITGRMQYLKNQDQYATLTISIAPKRPVITVSPVAWQPDVTAGRALHFLGALARWLGDALIWIVIVGGPFAVIVLSVRYLIKRFRRPVRPPERT